MGADNEGMTVAEKTGVSNILLDIRIKNVSAAPTASCQLGGRKLCTHLSKREETHTHAHV